MTSIINDSNNMKHTIDILYLNNKTDIGIGIINQMKIKKDRYELFKIIFIISKFSARVSLRYFLQDGKQDKQ